MISSYPYKFVVVGLTAGVIITPGIVQIWDARQVSKNSTMCCIDAASSAAGGGGGCLITLFFLMQPSSHCVGNDRVIQALVSSL